MANEEQVALLKQGSKVWNKWREENPDVEINFFRADLSGTNLSGADFTSTNLSQSTLIGANFKQAILHSADLRGADLSHAFLEEALLSFTNLGWAKLNEANLHGAVLNDCNLGSAELIAANLSDTNISNANLSYSNLSCANLCNSILNSTNLSDANLCDTNLEKILAISANFRNTKLVNANLIDADLREAIVLESDFTQATLTGACITDWQIGISTILDGVKCDYIFRTYDSEKRRFSGRLPVDPDSKFTSGEFTQRFQIIASALETIDITFTEGIDWQAFFQSFQKLRDNHPDEEISIQGMERKGDSFVVRLEADRRETETELKQLYAHQLAALEAQYEERLRLQGAHLEDIREILSMERQERTRLTKVVETMAHEQKAPKIQINQSTIGNLVDTAQSGSRVQNIQHIYAPEQQDLSEAAQEIQKLLNTLAETYNTTSETGQTKLMKELGAEIEKHPKWRRALKEGGIELIKVLCAPIGIPLEMARVYLEDNE